MTQVRDIVFVKCIFSLGNPRGSGFWNEGYMGWSGEMGRSVYEQPGTEEDRILTARRVPNKENKRGAKGMRKRGLLHNCIARPIFVYIVNACVCLNDCQSIYACIIIIGYECSDNLNCV